MPRDKPRQPLALGAVAAHQFALVGALEIGDQAEAILGEAARGDLADAVDQRHRLVGQECRGLGLAQHGEAARLVEVGGDLGQELVGGQPDGDGDAELLFDAAPKTAPAPWRRSCRAGARCRTDP